MHRVSYMTDSATRILHDLHQMLAIQDKALVYSRIRGRAVVEDALTRTLPDGSKGYLTFEDNDLAVEWCEDRLLKAITEQPAPIDSLVPFPLFAGMCEQTLALLQARMEPVEYPTGATIIAAGQEKDDRVFLIREGEVSVVLSLAHGAHQRIATLSSGMTFGEMVMLGQAARSANVHADTAVRCWTLTRARARRTRRRASRNQDCRTDQSVAGPCAEIAPGQSADQGVGGLVRSTGWIGAGEGNRTLVVSLGSFCSAIELHPLCCQPFCVRFSYSASRVKGFCHARLTAIEASLAVASGPACLTWQMRPSRSCAASHARTAGELHPQCHESYGGSRGVRKFNASPGR